MGRCPIIRKFYLNESPPVVLDEQKMLELSIVNEGLSESYKVYQRKRAKRQRFNTEEFEGTLGWLMSYVRFPPSLRTDGGDEKAMEIHDYIRRVHRISGICAEGHRGEQYSFEEILSQGKS